MGNNKFSNWLGGISHKDNAVNIGASIEQKALKWLKQKGLKVVTQNYHCTFGEIDIIMYDGDALVFVEVRFRKHSIYGGAIESVDWHKQQKIMKTATHFLASHPDMAEKNCRFDVLAASTDNQPLKHNIQWAWIKNAFES